MKFNGVFLASINICINEDYMECGTYYYDLILLLLSVTLTLVCSVFKTRICYSIFLCKTFFFNYYALLIVPKLLSEVCTLILSMTF